MSASKDCNAKIERRLKTSLKFMGVIQKPYCIVLFTGALEFLTFSIPQCFTLNNHDAGIVFISNNLL